MNSIFEAVRIACRHSTDAAQCPPEGFPPALAAAVMAGTYTTVAVIAAIMARHCNMHYGILLDEFGVPADKAPPEAEVLAHADRVISELGKKETAH